MKDGFKVYAPFVLLVIAGFAVAAYFIRPAPPSSIRLATGAPGGAYASYGKQFKVALAVDGIDVELVETSGSLDNLRLLRAQRLVRYRKQGRNVYYTLDDDHIRVLLDVALQHVTHR